MTIGVFGAGNMGGTVLKAIGEKTAHQVQVYDKDPGKQALYTAYGNVTFAASVAACMAGADLLFVCVKPMHIDALLQEMKAVGLPKGCILVSIAAGVKVARFTQILGEIPVVRTMPNLPAMVGEGFTGLYFHNMEDAAFAAGKMEIQALFDLLGKTRVYPAESYIDKMIAVTSSSPAYVCLFIEAMADGAVRLGFGREDAYLMAEQAVLGTAKYLRDGNVHPAVMKDRVCSPAGTTIEAVVALEEMGLRSSVLEAMEKCDRMTRG